MQAFRGTPWSRFREGIASDRCAYGLRRDLSVSVPIPPSRISITIRPLRLNDIPVLLSAHRRSRAGERTDPRVLIEAGVGRAYVAATESDIPCYMQWLITPDENDKIQKISGGLLPWLGSDELLLEPGFTVEPFRGLGIMPCVMSQIAELGGALGARWALTFAGEDDFAELKGCQLAGFRPYLLRRHSRRLFHRRVSFHLLPRGTPFPFDERASATDGLSLAG